MIFFKRGLVSRNGLGEILMHVNLLLHLPGGNSIGENGHQRDEEDEQQKVDQRHTGGKIFPVPERLVISLNV